jgi:hypothetical protein
MSNNVRNQPMYVAAGNLEAENQPYASDPYPGMLGSRVTVNSATGVTGAGAVGKTYQRVQVDSTVTVAPFPGAVAWWSSKASSLVTTAATNRGRVAGVFRNAITPGNIGFIQTQGPSNVKIVDAPTAAPTIAGLIVIPSATAGKADVLASGSAATFPAMGVTTGALQGGTAICAVDLDVPETT